MDRPTNTRRPDKPMRRPAQPTLSKPDYRDQYGQPGRPTLYREEMDRQVYKLTLLGAKDKELADFLGINVTTLFIWRSKHQSFNNSILDGRQNADAAIAKSLFHRAKGYSHKAVKIFCGKDGDVTQVEYVQHYPPDASCCIFWLKNRRSDLWRDRIPDKSDVDPESAEAQEIVKIVGGLPE